MCAKAKMYMGFFKVLYFILWVVVIEWNLGVASMTCLLTLRMSSHIGLAAQFSLHVISLGGLLRIEWSVAHDLFSSLIVLFRNTSMSLFRFTMKF